MPMPKTTMDKHDSSIVRQDKIRLSWKVFNLRPEPESRAPEGTASHHLGTGVFRMDSSHDPATFRNRDGISHDLLQPRIPRIQLVWEGRQPPLSAVRPNALVG